LAKYLKSVAHSSEVILKKHIQEFEPNLSEGTSKCGNTHTHTLKKARLWDWIYGINYGL